MFFKITTMSGVTIADELDENAPAIRLDEGRVGGGQKHPRVLSPGESTTVVYPLLSRSQGGNGGELGCHVKRLFDPTEQWALDHASGLAAGADEALEDRITNAIDTTKAETPRARRGGRRSRRVVES